MHTISPAAAATEPAADITLCFIAHHGYAVENLRNTHLTRFNRNRVQVRLSKYQALAVLMRWGVPESEAKLAIFQSTKRPGKYWRFYLPQDDAPAQPGGPVAAPEREGNA
jgi:hypothetical protein